ncbi:hypothetical protein SBA1_750031 [Candidatus Sulfotelmatobacter kueseliae]|uniref:Uncharacterized protein n=1 Tax=Candidatus Sulfotelmatobacter kueseliae TaxID=2042962 RepID=A0A2U3L6P5_9BACT|nr:hypothetical protein SBA1_750031 [Candidatus Sulfotelmatobacter kueseliae]
MRVRGVPIHGCCCLLRSPFGQIPRITDTTTDTKALKLLKTKSLAERVGFEPTLPFRVNTLSKRAPSATRPSLRQDTREGTASKETLTQRAVAP